MLIIKNDTKHRDKILHLPERTSNFYLFSTMALILILNIFMKVVIHIRFMGEKLEVLKACSRKLAK